MHLLSKYTKEFWSLKWKLLHEKAFDKLVIFHFASSLDVEPTVKWYKCVCSSWGMITLAVSTKINFAQGGKRKKEVVLQFQILSIRRNRSLRNSRMKKRRIITQSVLAHKKVTLILNLYLLSVMLLRFNTLAIFVVSKDQ